MVLTGDLILGLTVGLENLNNESNIFNIAPAHNTPPIIADASIKVLILFLLI